jgi:hypothetical protein
MTAASIIAANVPLQAREYHIGVHFSGGSGPALKAFFYPTIFGAVVGGPLRGRSGHLLEGKLTARSR